METLIDDCIELTLQLVDQANASFALDITGGAEGVEYVTPSHIVQTYACAYPRSYVDEEKPNQDISLLKHPKAIYTLEGRRRAQDDAQRRVGPRNLATPERRGKVDLELKHPKRSRGKINQNTQRRRPGPD